MSKLPVFSAVGTLGSACYLSEVSIARELMVGMGKLLEREFQMNA